MGYHFGAENKLNCELFSSDKFLDMIIWNINVFFSVSTFSIICFCYAYLITIINYITFYHDYVQANIILKYCYPNCFVSSVIRDKIFGLDC